MAHQQYIPEKGDVVWIDFDPSAGKEIQERRPGVVVSTYHFNRTTGFSVICPITSTLRESKILFTLPKENIVTGQVVIAQLKSLDFRTRKIEFVEKLSEVEMKKIDQVIEYIF